MRLGWRQPRANDYQGPDSRPLKDTFASLQQYMTWPHIHVRDDSLTVNAATGTFAAWDNEIDDPYTLHNGTSVDIMVPRDFDTWMLVGQAAGKLTSPGGAGRRAITWAVNSTLTEWGQTNMDDQASANSVVGIIQQVKKGDTIQVQIFNGAAGNDGWVVRASMFFLPMA